MPYGHEFALNGWWFTRIPSAGDARPDVVGKITTPDSDWYGEWKPDGYQRPSLITSGNYGACVCHFDKTRQRINRDVTVMVKMGVEIAT